MGYFAPQRGSAMQQPHSDPPTPRRPYPGPLIPATAVRRGRVTAAATTGRGDPPVATGAWMRVLPRGAGGADVRSESAAFRSSTSRQALGATAVAAAAGAGARGAGNEGALGTGAGRARSGDSVAHAGTRSGRASGTVPQRLFPGGAGGSLGGTMGKAKRDYGGFATGKDDAMPGPGAYDPVSPPARSANAGQAAFRSSSSRLARMTGSAWGVRREPALDPATDPAEPREWAAVAAVRQRLGIHAGPGSGGAGPIGPGSYDLPSGNGMAHRAHLNANPRRGWV